LRSSLDSALSVMDDGSSKGVAIGSKLKSAEVDDGGGALSSRQAGVMNTQGRNRLPLLERRQLTHRKFEQRRK
jgi:hypothetical protein